MSRQLIQFFEYEHLPPHLQIVSRRFSEFVKSFIELDRSEINTEVQNILKCDDSSIFMTFRKELHGMLPANIEGSEAIIKLNRAISSMCLEEHLLSKLREDIVIRLILEAKDCAVRSILFKD